MENRLDIVLVNQGLAKSREKAKALIKEGKVYINNKVQTKASQTVDEDTLIEIRGDVCEFVSRGGYKLKKAIEHFGLNLTDKVCLDIGASTGGFTDCMLKNGAVYVYAVDVGHDQLDDTLRSNKCVKSMEGVNFRYIEKRDFDKDIAFASCDVSFISLKHILPKAFEVLLDNSEMVCLIKPQFEAGKEHLNKKGVVKDQKIHVKVIREIIEFAENTGFYVVNLTYSPIKGPEGNIEYLVHLIKSSNEQLSKASAIHVNASNTVSEAFNE